MSELWRRRLVQTATAAEAVNLNHAASMQQAHITKLSCRDAVGITLPTQQRGIIAEETQVSVWNGRSEATEVGSGADLSNC